MTSAQLAARLDLIARAGATQVRYDLPWSVVQPDSAKTYDWTGIDMIMSAVAQRGMTNLPILDGTPAWARVSNCSSSECPPANDSQFAAFAAAAAARYKGSSVSAWEVWNEPNRDSGWSPAPNASAYSALLKETSVAIHGVSPRAVVLIGGLSPAVDQLPVEESPQSFVTAIYATAGPASFNGIAMHPYCFPALPGETQTWSGWTQMQAVESIMVAKGDAAKQIWITEFGAPTDGPGAEATLASRQYSSSPDHVDQDFQAQTVTSGLTFAERHTWIHSIAWYSIEDLGSDASNSGDWYGLLTISGAPKAAYTAWVNITGGH
jgi:hypothetical protein